MSHGRFREDDRREGDDRPGRRTLTAPHAIVRTADGKARWVARCPRCADRNREAVVSADADEARAACPKCGTVIEVRASGAYPVAPVVDTPEE